MRVELGGSAYPARQPAGEPAADGRLIPVVISIHVEPAKRELDLDPLPTWPETDMAFEYFQALRTRLAGLTDSPAHFTWLLRLDPQIEKVWGDPGWSVDRYRQWWDRLDASGDELGVHTHMWRWSDSKSRWIADYADGVWVEHCLRLSFATFEKRFARKARTHVFGDAWLSRKALALVEKLGCQYEMTVEPGGIPGSNKHELVVGAFPDYRGAPAVPYRPSPFDYRRPGRLFKRKIWIIPTTTHELTAKELGQPYSDATYPWTVHMVAAPSHVIPSLEEILARPDCGVLVFQVRTGDLHRDDNRDNYFQNMEYLLRRPESKRFRFMRPDEALALWRGRPRPEPATAEGGVPGACR